MSQDHLLVTIRATDGPQYKNATPVDVAIVGIVSDAASWPGLYYTLIAPDKLDEIEYPDDDSPGGDVCSVPYCLAPLETGNKSGRCVDHQEEHNA